MPDPRDELRDALAAQHDEDAARQRTEDELARACERYEEEERLVLSRLGEAADLVFETLLHDVPPDSIPAASVSQESLFRPKKQVEGWKIKLFEQRYVLFADGTLLQPKAFRNDRTPRPSTLRKWLQQQCRDVRLGNYPEDETTPWDEAFSPDCLPSSGDRAAAQASLRSRLAEMKESVTKELARVLHERGASL
jgi:hypothetical protein